MKKRIMSFLMVVCLSLVMFSFAACSGGESSDDGSIVGKWEYESSSEMYYTFNEDGTGAYTFAGADMKFTYEDDGKAVTIKYENSTEPNVFEYKIEGKKLLIQDSFGEFVTYIKK